MRIRPLGLALAAAAALLAGRAPAATRVFVTCTDYGVSGTLDDALDGAPWTHNGSVAVIGSDAISRYHEGLLYVVNRQGGDNIQVLDPANSYHLVRQFSTGPGSNPQDIAFASPTKAYVSRYESADVWIVNPQTGVHTGTISLAGFADADGLPEMARMAVVGRRLFVALELLDRANFYAPTGPGKLAVIDMNADTVMDADPAAPGIQAITLTGPNPTTQVELDRRTGKLLVGETGNYGVNDGGIEQVDPVGLSALGFAVTEDSLGGDVLAIASSSESGDACFAIISDAGFNTAAVKTHLALHGHTRIVRQGAGFVLSDIGVDGDGLIWLTDRTPGAAGLRAYDVVTDLPLFGPPIATSLPPNGLAFDREVAVGVRPGAAPPSLSVRAIGSNVFQGSVSFEIRGASGSVTARILDISGRTVRALAVGASGRVSWDGRTASGQPSAAGVYWLQVENAQRRAEARVLRL